MTAIFQPIIVFISSVPLWALGLFIWILAIFYHVGIKKRSFDTTFDTTSSEHLAILSVSFILFALNAKYMSHAAWFTMWGLYYGLSFLVGAGLGWLLGKISPLYVDTKRSLIKAPGVPVIIVFAIIFFSIRHYINNTIEADSEVIIQSYVISLYVVLLSFMVGAMVGCSSCYISRFNAIKNADRYNKQ